MEVSFVIECQVLWVLATLLNQVFILLEVVLVVGFEGLNEHWSFILGLRVVDDELLVILGKTNVRNDVCMLGFTVFNCFCPVLEAIGEHDFQIALPPYKKLSKSLFLERHFVDWYLLHLVQVDYLFNLILYSLLVRQSVLNNFQWLSRQQFFWYWRQKISFSDCKFERLLHVDLLFGNPVHNDVLLLANYKHFRFKAFESTLRHVQALL